MANKSEDSGVTSENNTFLLDAVESGHAADLPRLFQTYQAPLFSKNALFYSVIRASYLGHEPLLQFLLQNGAPLEARDNLGNTPLLICAEKGRRGMVKMLLAKGADVNAVNRNGDTALILAESPEVIHQLLDHRSIDFDRQNFSGCTALMCAIERLHLKKVLLLIQSGHSGYVYARPCIYRVNKSGESAIKIAERVGIARLVETFNRPRKFNLSIFLRAALRSDSEMFDLHFQRNICDLAYLMSLEPNILGSLLFWIQRRKRIGRIEEEVIQTVIRSGFDLNRYGGLVTSTLEIAAESGQYDLVEALHHHGVSITHACLLAAVKQKRTAMVSFLADRGAPMYQLDEDGCFVYQGSVLDLALDGSDTGSAKVLLKHGARIDVELALEQAVKRNSLPTMEFILDHCPEDSLLVINSRHDILHKAVANMNIVMVSLLLSWGADLRDIHNDKTALLVAVEVEVLTSAEDDIPVKILRLLLEKGADVNFTDASGNSALHVAAKLRKLKMVTTLLRHGANVNTQNKLGRTPLYYAAEISDASDNRIVEELLSNDANVNVQDNLGDTPLLIASNFPGDRCELIDLFLVSGADVNLRNKNGLSALTLAAEGVNERVMHALLTAGADVNNAVLSAHGMPRSALSVLLNKWYPRWDSQNLALELVERGASVKHVRPDVLHRLIALNNARLIQKLISSGLCPTDVSLTSTFYQWPLDSISPLAVCLITKNLELAKRFIDTRYLTKSDLKILSRCESILNFIESRDPEALEYLVDVSSQPPRLELLCFVSISAAVGPGPDRVDKIKNSPLPRVMQDQLMYSNMLDTTFNGRTDTSYLDAFESISELTLVQEIVDCDLFPSYYNKDLDFYEDHYSDGISIDLDTSSDDD